MSEVIRQSVAQEYLKQVSQREITTLEAELISLRIQEEKIRLHRENTEKTILRKKKKVGLPEVLPDQPQPKAIKGKKA